MCDGAPALEGSSIDDEFVHWGGDEIKVDSISVVRGNRIAESHSSQIKTSFRRPETRDVTLHI